MLSFLIILFLARFGEYRAEEKTEECGSSLFPLITGGLPIVPGQYPWLAALYHKNDSGQWNLICGGTLISQDVVVTAAHCFQNVRYTSEIRVGLGKTHRDMKINETNSQIVLVDESYIPEYYVGISSRLLDVALLRLAYNVPITPYIMPACFDWEGDNTVYSSTKGNVAGWGKSENSTETEEALAVKLSYIDFRECRRKLFGSVYVRVLTHHGFCALSDKGGQVEPGDSGGGMTVLHNGRYYLIGVVSWKVIGETTFSVFTNLSNPEIHSLIRRVTTRWKNPACGTLQMTISVVQDENFLTNQPWIAAVYERNGTNWNYICGGTLISNHIVLTAAHCVIHHRGKIKPEIKVGLGKPNIKFDVNGPQSIIANVREVVVHRNYSGAENLFAFDVALLDLEETVKLTSHITPACLLLDTTENVIPDGIGTAFGWYNPNRSPDFKRGSNVSFFNHAKCKEKLQSENPISIAQDKMCIEPNSDILSSTSMGGASLVYLKETAYYVVGVFSQKTETLYLLTDMRLEEHNNWLRLQKRRLDKLH